MPSSLLLESLRVAAARQGRAPTDDELKIIREVIDPAGIAGKEVKG